MLGPGRAQGLGFRAVGFRAQGFRGLSLGPVGFGVLGFGNKGLGLKFWGLVGALGSGLTANLNRMLENIFKHG